MRFNRSLRASLLCAACFALPVAAGAEVITLDEIIVSGGLTGIAAEAYGRAVTVLDAAEIEERGIVTVQDALRIIPGVSVSSAGASMTQIRIRGGEANHTLILIDGVEATGGSDEYILTGLETANIERIEVLRGPQSAFYGSNASAGVINIITKKGEEGVQSGGSVELGNGSAASAFISQRTQRGGLAFSLSARDDNGFDQSGDGGEKDGITRKTANLSGDWQATDDLTLGFTLRRATEDYDSDSASWTATDADSYVVDDPTQTSTRDETSGAVWGEYSLMDGRLVQRLEWQDTIFKQNYNGGPVTRGETEKLKYRLSYGLDGRPVAEAAHILNLLAERQKDHSSEAPAYARDMTSVALEYRGFLENGLDIQAGVRRDDNKVFDDFTSWNIGLSWRIPDTVLRLHGSAGRASVNPAYYELYADDAYTQGNPGLAPETSRGFDLGIEAELLDGRGVIDATYFNEKLTDEITYVYGAAPDGSGRATYENQPGTSPRQGLELAGRLQATDALSLALNYTWLDAENPDGSVEIRRPEHEIGLSATLQTFGGRGSVTGDIRHVMGNWDTQYWGSYPTVELPDATTVNLSASYDLTESVQLTGRVTNLFDAENTEVWGYATQGRTLYAGLQATW
ncbi:vitamin B12 transporter [Gemmobacter aquatilis]|uniref:Vitamin B12 transporter n=1 Tax=Gemmobacter aquatilis TaxID=933059 RepID=A0A1H8DND1_9RHOB|nr:TonB-dependent receptor [Gemmobacter aquatilis]SEN08740.1 vitamin B12 transporter [Gemmobacter aquatilis]